MPRDALERAILISTCLWLTRDAAEAKDEKLMSSSGLEATEEEMQDAMDQDDDEIPGEEGVVAG